ncbi:uncharacterized protein LOC118566354 [Fundulus heteroclitus]|uniref:uncharacterized protein LOC118566354 n=1 Tax=Fundulus heteroclitus TaxID=8078 RepID=UPI00165AC957|nr:uncharacterized protein LOC118566354 [Fundulus heteroclitus]
MINSTNLLTNLSLSGYPHLLCTSTTLSPLLLQPVLNPFQFQILTHLCLILNRTGFPDGDIRCPAHTSELSLRTSTPLLCLLSWLKCSSIIHHSLTCQSTLQHFADPQLPLGKEGPKETIINSTNLLTNLSLSGYPHLLCTRPGFLRETSDCSAHTSELSLRTSTPLLCLLSWHKCSSIIHRSLTCQSILQHFADPQLPLGKEGPKETMINSTNLLTNLSLSGYPHLLCTRPGFLRETSDCSAHTSELSLRTSTPLLCLLSWLKCSSIIHRSLTCQSTLQHFADPQLPLGKEGPKETMINSTNLLTNLSLSGYPHLLCTRPGFLRET